MIVRHSLTLSLSHLSCRNCSRSKEKMIKDVHGITEELYKQHDFNRLLRILQRFGSQRDEIKRKNSSQKTSDGEEEIDFSIDFTDRSTNGKKRPTASIITTTIKKKRASGSSL